VERLWKGEEGRREGGDIVVQGEGEIVEGGDVSTGQRPGMSSAYSLDSPLPVYLRKVWLGLPRLAGLSNGMSTRTPKNH